MHSTPFLPSSSLPPSFFLPAPPLLLTHHLLLLLLPAAKGHEGEEHGLELLQLLRLLTQHVQQLGRRDLQPPTPRTSVCELSNNASSRVKQLVCHNESSSLDAMTGTHHQP